MVQAHKKQFQQPARMLCVSRRSKTLLLLTCAISFVAFLLTSSPTAEAKKLDKKLVKSLVKGLVLQNLSTRKNFVPLPVPIPGKWQQLFNTMLDSGMFEAPLKPLKQLQAAASSGAAQSLAANLNFNGAGDKFAGSRLGSSRSKGHLNSIVSGASEQQASGAGGSDKGTSNKLGAKLFFGLVESLAGRKKQPAKRGAELSPQSTKDLANVKKVTRLAAAKYATRLISKQALGTIESNSNTNAATKIANIKRGAAEQIKDTAPEGTQDPGNKRMDMLVTAFNVVKLAQQIRELDPVKLLNLSKKSSIVGGSSGGARLPILSMNINNRKTFLNKMNYIHKLTSDLHHRHRNNQNILALM